MLVVALLLEEVLVLVLVLVRVPVPVLVLHWEQVPSQMLPGREPARPVQNEILALPMSRGSKWSPAVPPSLVWRIASEGASCRGMNDCLVMALPLAGDKG
ncbi:hypothetical protein AK812_SmicGene25115 [Symbiodinium microadriaticum]|uniref:Uncharacterized protein n=1 Tax=Symbiodinium microadriaticum TaxID=2951 RepID=A0A1Q9DCY5_SYMMI|nr:hypothetical protein AK812_SmicGene25115 [Symbiodinium microadriaticum]